MIDNEKGFKAPSIGANPLPEVTLNGDTERLYDADTTIPSNSFVSNKSMDQSEKYRFKNVDAAEFPSVDPLSGINFGVFAEEQRDLVADKINKGGYNKAVPTEKDFYGRQLANIESPSGFDLGLDLVKQNLMKPSRYDLSNPDMQEATTFANLESFIKGREQLPEWRKLELDFYHGSTPSLGALQPYEELRLPKSLFSPETRESYGFGDQAVDSMELWMYQNLSSLEGIRALLGDQDTAYGNLKKIQQDMSEDIDSRAIISIEQIEDVPTFFKWLEGALVTQGPDYAIMAGSAAAPVLLGSNPIGWGLSAAGAGYIYLKTTGNVAAEQMEVAGEPSQSAWAIGGLITAIDRLGAKGIIKPDDFMTKEGIERASKVVQQKFKDDFGEEISEAEAKKILTEQVKSSIKDTATELGIKTADLITKRQAAIGLAKRMFNKAGSEGLTEITQESIQALAINGAPETAEEWQRLGWRLADAGAAGLAVGGVYNINNSLLERNRIESLREDVNEDLSQAPKHAKISLAANKAWGFKDVEKISEDFRSDAVVSLDDMADKSKGGYFARGVQNFFEGKLIPLSSAIKNTVRGYIYDKNGRINPYTAYISTVEGAFNILSGDSLYNQEQRRLSRFTYADWLNSPEKAFGISKKELNDLILDAKSKFYDLSVYEEGSKERIILEKVLKDSRDIRMTLSYDFNRAGMESVGQQFKANIGILFEKLLPDSQKISDNYQDFLSKLADLKLPIHYKGKNIGDRLGIKEAEKLVLEFFDGDAGIATTDFERMKLSTNPEFAEYFPNNIVDSIREKILRDTKYAVRTQYRGKNNSIYANMLNRAVKEGYMKQEEADRFAADLRDQIAKHGRAFGRLKNKTLSNVQDITRTATSFGLMDLVLFSQPAELVLAFIGRNQSLTKNLGSLAKGFTIAFKNSLPKIAEARRKRSESDNIYDFYRGLGYQSLDIVNQQGANLDNKVLRDLQSKFYRITGLEQMTDAGRISQMILGQDVIHQMMEQLVDVDIDNMTVGQAKLFERLTYYGINVPDLQALYRLGGNIKKLDEIPEALQLSYFEMMSIALPKFIDETMVRIKPGGRASIFEDQRFGLPFLTQYMSFISSFHANQLPRYYQTYLKDAAAPMAFNTFKVMTTAILIAYVSQYLKDLLTRGELNPKLDEDTGAIQRAFQYSGLGGMYQDAFDNIVGNPYGFKAEGIFDYILNAPTVSHLSRVAKDVGEGEYAAAAQRALPFGELTKEEAAPRTLFRYLTEGN